MRKRSEKKYTIIPWAAAALLLLIFSVSGNMYRDADSYEVAAVINGILGENNFCQYQHPLLCLILKGIKSLLPGADCFTLFTQLITAAALGYMLKLLLSRYKDTARKILVWAAALYIFLGVDIFAINYTVRAAFLCFAGMTGLFGNETYPKGRVAVSTIFFLLGMMLRHQAALLFLPFFALAAFAEALQAYGREKDKKALKDKLGELSFRLLPWAAGCIILMLSFVLFYSAEPYRSGILFDRARVTLGDFPTEGWEELEKKAEGFDRHLYKSARLWFYADTDELTLEKLQTMAEAGRSSMFEWNAEGIAEALAGMVLGGASRYLTELIPMLILLLITVHKLISGKLSPAALTAAGAFLGCFVIILYFTVRGRALDRVWISVMLAASGHMASMPGQDEYTGSRKKEILWLSAISLLFFVSAMISVAKGGKIELHPPVTPFNAAAGADEGEFAEVYASDVHYLVCGWDSPGESAGGHFLHGWREIQDKYRDQEKLPPKEFFEHYISSGWFGYGQDYYLTFLREQGLENPVKALFERDDVFLLDMSGDTVFREFFYVYLYDRYGDMTVKKVDEIDSCPVYSFRK